jgi:hypothetical protein
MTLENAVLNPGKITSVATITENMNTQGTKVKIAAVLLEPPVSVPHLPFKYAIFSPN